jgi:hypothetical protein
LAAARGNKWVVHVVGLECAGKRSDLLERLTRAQADELVRALLLPSLLAVVSPTFAGPRFFLGKVVCPVLGPGGR